MIGIELLYGTVVDYFERTPLALEVIFDSTSLQTGKSNRIVIAPGDLTGQLHTGIEPAIAMDAATATAICSVRERWHATIVGYDASELKNYSAQFAAALALHDGLLAAVSGLATVSAAQILRKSEGMQHGAGIVVTGFFNRYCFPPLPQYSRAKLERFVTRINMGDPLDVEETEVPLLT